MVFTASSGLGENQLKLNFNKTDLLLISGGGLKDTVDISCLDDVILPVKKKIYNLGKILDQVLFVENCITSVTKGAILSSAADKSSVSLSGRVQLGTGATLNGNQNFALLQCIFMEVVDQ